MQSTPEERSAARLCIYSEEKMERLYRGALRVLKETGCFIDQDHFLSTFEKHGMEVDHAKRRVRFTEDIINRLLDPYPGKGDDLEVPRSFPVRLGIGGSYPKYYDWATGKTSSGTRNDLMELLRVFNTMEEFTTVGRILTLTDVPQPIEPIIASALVIKHSPSPGRGEVYRAHNIPYLIELGEIITGKPGCADFIPSCTFIVPPLRITKDEADLILEKARHSIPAVAGTMPSSGATAPVTREGTIVIELAEVIATWLCYRAVNPDIPLGATCASSSFDMQRGVCRFSSPEAIIQDCASAQILTRYFGVHARTSSGYVDAKQPGVRTTYEKLFKTWWPYQFQGYVNFGPGLLDAGQVFCAAQALLDMDMWRTVNALFADEPDVSVEIPFEDIRDVAHQGGTFLATDHTCKLFRQVLHTPEFFGPEPRRPEDEEVATEEDILGCAQARYEAIRESASEYRAPEHICRAVDDVVEKATKAILH